MFRRGHLFAAFTDRAPLRRRAVRRGTGCGDRGGGGGDDGGDVRRTVRRVRRVVVLFLEDAIDAVHERIFDLLLRPSRHVKLRRVHLAYRPATGFERFDQVVRLAGFDELFAVYICLVPQKDDFKPAFWVPLLNLG